MICFVDESGDLGFKFYEGSTRHIVIAMVIFINTEEADKATIAIEKFARLVSKKKSLELKFNNSSKVTRLAFLKIAKQLHFSFTAYILDKTAIYKMKPRDLYIFLLERLLIISENELSNAKIIIDGQISQNYEQMILSHLKNNTQINKKTISKVKFEDSRKNKLLQLADFIAGSVRKTIEPNVADSHIYFREIQEKTRIVVKE